MKKKLKAFSGDLLMRLLLDNPKETNNKIIDDIRIILHQNLSIKSEVIGCDTKHYISGIDKSVEKIYELLQTLKR